MIKGHIQFQTTSILHKLVWAETWSMLKQTSWMALERLNHGNLETLFSEIKLDAHWMHSILKKLIKAQKPFFKKEKKKKAQ